MAMTEGGKFDGGHTYRDSGDKNQLSYLDLIERSTNEEEKRQRERLIADEGIQLWKSKRNTEIEQIEKDKQTVRKTTKGIIFLRGRKNNEGYYRKPFCNQNKPW